MKSLADNFQFSFTSVRVGRIIKEGVILQRSYYAYIKRNKLHRVRSWLLGGYSTVFPI